MHKMRRVELPAQFFFAEKVRLGMRLPAATALHASLQRQAPAGVRLVRFGEAQAADANGWAKVIAAAGDRPTVEAAMDQWKLEFAAHEAELRKRMYFAIDEADGTPIGTATAWLCAPSPAEDLGVEIFNAGPAALAVSSVVSHRIASVNRLPWE